MSSSLVELNPPDLLFVTLAVVEGCVQRVRHILAVVQLANSATLILKKKLFKTITYWQLVSFQNGASGIHIFSHTS